MYIYNVSFICDPSAEHEVVEALREFTRHGQLADGMKLLKVAEVPDNPEYAAESTTLTLQIPFEFMDECRSFGERRLPAILEGMHKRFGNGVLPFSTILETLDL